MHELETEPLSEMNGFDRDLNFELLQEAEETSHLLRTVTQHQRSFSTKSPTPPHEI